jgi:hypothetical protein
MIRRRCIAVKNSGLKCSCDSSVRVNSIMWGSPSVVFRVGTAAHRFDSRPVIYLTSSKWRRVETFLTAPLRFMCKLRPVVWDRHPLCEGQIFYPECLSVFSGCACCHTTLQLCGGIGQINVVTSTRNRRFVCIHAPAFGVGSRDPCFNCDASLLNTCWDLVLA